MLTGGFLHGFCQQNSRTPKQSACKIPKLAGETLKPRKSIPNIGERLMRLPKLAGDILKPPRKLYKMPKLMEKIREKPSIIHKIPWKKVGTTHNSCPSSKLLERQAIRRPARRPAISWSVLYHPNPWKKTMHFLVEHVAMDQSLEIPFIGMNIHKSQLFWCSPWL